MDGDSDVEVLSEPAGGGTRSTVTVITIADDPPAADAPAENTATCDASWGARCPLKPRFNTAGMHPPPRWLLPSAYMLPLDEPRAARARFLARARDAYAVVSYAGVDIPIDVLRRLTHAAPDATPSAAPPPGAGA